METKVRLMILARGYPEPVPNLEFIDPATGIVYYVDLAYPQWKIAIEYDGQGHWDDKQQWEKDLHKNEVLHDQAWKVLRIAIADYMEPETFLDRKKHTSELQSRGHLVCRLLLEKKNNTTIDSTQR